MNLKKLFIGISIGLCSVVVATCLAVAIDALVYHADYGVHEKHCKAIISPEDVVELRLCVTHFKKSPQDAINYLESLKNAEYTKKVEK